MWINVQKAPASLQKIFEGLMIEHFHLDKLCLVLLFKWNVVFICGYGCWKKTIVKN